MDMEQKGDAATSEGRENRRVGDRASRESTTEPLPFDFVDFLCAVRDIERDAALQLLREFVVLELRSASGLRRTRGEPIPHARPRSG